MFPTNQNMLGQKKLEVQVPKQGQVPKHGQVAKAPYEGVGDTLDTRKYLLAQKSDLPKNLFEVPEHGSEIKSAWPGPFSGKGAFKPIILVNKEERVQQQPAKRQIQIQESNQECNLEGVPEQINYLKRRLSILESRLAKAKIPKLKNIKKRRKISEIHRNYKCFKCRRIYGSKSSAKNHILIKHKVEKSRVFFLKPVNGVFKAVITESPEQKIEELMIKNEENGHIMEEEFESESEEMSEEVEQNQGSNKQAEPQTQKK